MQVKMPTLFFAEVVLSPAGFGVLSLELIFSMLLLMYAYSGIVSMA